MPKQKWRAAKGSRHNIQSEEEGVRWDRAVGPFDIPKLSKDLLSEPVRILSIGGGTGLSSLLKGLKEYAEPYRQSHHTNLPALPRNVRIDLTALVTVTDDGGSSGRLRREFDVLPPGDIRNCMVALSDDEGLLGRLFQYRFESGRGLKGHSFGNLFLTALTQLTGDFAHAVQLSSEVLAINGKIFPSTAENVSLEAVMVDGSVVAGETNISKSKLRIDHVRLRPQQPQPLDATLKAIEKADLITLGPGSLFTSVAPNLLVEGIAGAIRRSAAVKAYFCNLMWQPGETVQFSAADHVEAIHRHAGGALLDCVIVNTRPLSAPLRKRYAAQRALPVDVDLERLETMGLRIVEAELLAHSDKARHDPQRAAEIAIRLALIGRKRRWKAMHLEGTAG
ncbi:MAG: YvcK family protein [Acidobacteria bacterium]|nr:YvcK family protein [Acidobacteriota bacterium]